MGPLLYTCMLCDMNGKKSLRHVLLYSSLRVRTNHNSSQIQSVFYFNKSAILSHNLQNKRCFVNRYPINKKEKIFMIHFKCFKIVLSIYLQLFPFPLRCEEQVCGPHGRRWNRHALSHRRRTLQGCALLQRGKTIIIFNT